MFTKMRATIAAERRRADEAVRQLAEYRQQVEQERRQEREAFMAALAEERRRSDEERQQMQQAFMASLTEITAQMTHLIQQRNGSNGDERNGS